jgi:hypothetical protein
VLSSGLHPFDPRSGPANSFEDTTCRPTPTSSGDDRSRLAAVHCSVGLFWPGPHDRHAVSCMFSCPLQAYQCPTWMFVCGHVCYIALHGLRCLIVSTLSITHRHQCCTSRRVLHIFCIWSHFTSLGRPLLLPGVSPRVRLPPSPWILNRCLRTGRGPLSFAASLSHRGTRLGSCQKRPIGFSRSAGHSGCGRRGRQELAID